MGTGTGTRTGVGTGTGTGTNIAGTKAEWEAFVKQYEEAAGLPSSSHQTYAHPAATIASAAANGQFATDSSRCGFCAVLINHTLLINRGFGRGVAGDRCRPPCRAGRTGEA